MGIKEDIEALDLAAARWAHQFVAVPRDQLLRLLAHIHNLAELVRAQPAVVEAGVAMRQMRDATGERIAELEREVAAKQARIDALMFEHCPDEMTPEQVAEWGRHQRVVHDPAVAAGARAKARAAVDSMGDSPLSMSMFASVADYEAAISAGQAPERQRGLEHG
jgi:hypothetical protein